MKTALHKATMTYIRDIKDADLSKYPAKDYIIDAEKKTAVKDVPRKYWKMDGSSLKAMNEKEMKARDLQNPSSEDDIGFTGVVNNPSRLKIVNGIIVEAS